MSETKAGMQENLVHVHEMTNTPDPIKCTAGHGKKRSLERCLEGRLQ